MITATITSNGPLTFHCEVSGLAIYLDNYALINLAKGDADRRRRFISALHNGAELLFSIANLAELAGPQGRSREAVRTFLHEIGPHWFPTELS